MFTIYNATKMNKRNVEIDLYSVPLSIRLCLNLSIYL